MRPSRLRMFGHPLLATTLIPPGETEPLNDAHEIRARDDPRASRAFRPERMNSPLEKRKIRLRGL